MLHMSEYLTSKERHTYLHLENTTHSSLLWLSQKGFSLQSAMDNTVFPPPQESSKVGLGTKVLASSAQ